MTSYPTIAVRSTLPLFQRLAIMDCDIDFLFRSLLKRWDIPLCYYTTGMFMTLTVLHFSDAGYTGLAFCFSCSFFISCNVWLETFVSFLDFRLLTTMIALTRKRNHFFFVKGNCQL